MTYLNTQLVSNDVLIRKARLHVHCLFIALPENLPHRQVMHFVSVIENLDTINDLAELIKFANEMEAANPNREILAQEMALCAGL